MEYIACSMHLINGDTQPAAVEEHLHSNVRAVRFRGQATGPLDIELGGTVTLRIPGIARWMADFRHSEYWCRPEFGTDPCQIPNDTQGLVWETKDGGFGVILPVVSEQYKCTLSGTEEGLQARLYSWKEGLNTCDCLAFLWAEGADPFTLLQSCAQVGATLLGSHIPVRTGREYPKLFEYLGWCSWDAFEIRVSEKDLLAKCREFQDKEIPVKWMILDDMWAEVRDFYSATYETRRDMIRLMHNSRLYNLQADPFRFPKGLQHCLNKIKGFGITPGIWYPTTGYWRGADPEGPLARKLTPHLFYTTDGRLIHKPEEEAARAFYDTFNSYLAEAGAAFVKIDNQSMSRRFFKNRISVGQAARSFHKAMEDSVENYFDNNLINCMGMANEDMWNRPRSAVSRCSDDFLPEDKAWFTKHILQCSYNSLIQGQFYYCDWDMWWTDDGQAVKNSILRAISGGPIYVSDQLHRSRKEILEPLILNDGRILRCDRPAMPTADCLTEDPQRSSKLFKLQNICKGRGVLAVFNLDAEEKPVSGTISPQQIPGLEGEEFAVYEHFSESLTFLQWNESMPLTLKNSDDYRLYILAPMKRGNCVIGDRNKFISPAALDEKEQLIQPGCLVRVENRKLVQEKIK